MEKLQQQQQKTESQRPTHMKRVPSIGERIFDSFTYIGLAMVGTFIATLPLAYAQKYGGDNKVFGALSNGLQKAGEKVANGLQKLGVSKTASMRVIDTTSLMHGGNAMLIPIGIVEHFKQPIVNTINNTLGDKTDPAEIAEVPKQTLGSLLAGRIMAWGAVFASFTVASKVFGKQLGQFEDAIGRATCGFLNKPVIEDSKAFRYGKLAALDVFATIAAGSLLYFGSHMVAKPKQPRIAKTHGVTGARHADELDQNDTTVLPATAEAPSTRISEASRDGLSLATIAQQPALA